MTANNVHTPGIQARVETYDRANLQVMDPGWIQVSGGINYSSDTGKVWKKDMGFEVVRYVLRLSSLFTGSRCSGRPDPSFCSNRRLINICQEHQVRGSLTQYV